MITYKEFKELQKELCYIYENIVSIAMQKHTFSDIEKFWDNYSWKYVEAISFKTNNIFLKFIVKLRIETIKYWNKHIQHIIKLRVMNIK